MLTFAPAIYSGYGRNKYLPKGFYGCISRTHHILPPLDRAKGCLTFFNAFATVCNASNTPWKIWKQRMSLPPQVAIIWMIYNHIQSMDSIDNLLDWFTQRRSQVRVLFRPPKNPYPRGFLSVLSHMPQSFHAAILVKL
jgi:hypothetical protein